MINDNQDANDVHMYSGYMYVRMYYMFMYMYIRESVDFLCMDDTDAPITYLLHVAIAATFELPTMYMYIHVCIHSISLYVH